ncbi:hypothetical protein TNCV_2677581 [Trichonephila clavipes]|nr:hypothetical protein TNCV_2677581 [Trichonephila clavipes]
MFNPILRASFPKDKKACLRAVVVWTMISMSSAKAPNCTDLLKIFPLVLILESLTTSSNARLKLYHSQAMSPLRYSGDSMRTWRYRAKSASFLATNGKNKYWIARFSGSSSDRGSFRVTRSTNDRGFPGQWASELSTCLGIEKCREGMQSETGEGFSPLVRLLVSHWEDGSLEREGELADRENIISRERGVVGPYFPFMGDNARPQKSVEVPDTLQSGNVICMQWPAYSPYLNPIEHAWNALGRHAAQRTIPPRQCKILKPP